MKKIALLFTLISLLASCGRVAGKAKDALNKGGETIGKGATEFIEGVSEGVDRTLECDLQVSEDLKNKGVRIGKFSINNDSVGENNLLTVYLIFDQAINRELIVKATDKKGVEEGRVRQKISGKAGDAAFYDFHFDPRTYIEVKSKITIE